MKFPLRKPHAAAVLLALAALLLLGGCARSMSSMRVREINGERVYDGQSETLYTVEESEPLRLRVQITRSSGTLCITAQNLDTGEYAYRGASLPSSVFTVELSGPGTYRLTIRAKRFHGFFDVTPCADADASS